MVLLRFLPHHYRFDEPICAWQVYRGRAYVRRKPTLPLFLYLRHDDEPCRQMVFAVPADAYYFTWHWAFLPRAMAGQSHGWRNCAGGHLRYRATDLR